MLKRLGLLVSPLFLLASAGCKIEVNHHYDPQVIEVKHHHDDQNIDIRKPRKRPGTGSSSDE